MNIQVSAGEAPMPCTPLWLVLTIGSTLLSDDLLIKGVNAALPVTLQPSVVPIDRFTRQAQGGRRALQQEEKESEEICGKQCVTVVRSENAFETAVKAGASFIEIRAHLNLTELQSTLEIESSTKTIRGKCDDPAPDVDLPASHAPLLPLEKDQCLLFASSNLISVNSSNLWIDKLYIRFTTARDVEFTHLIEARGAAGNLWTTNTTLQGNGDGLRDCWACGIYTWEGAKSYAEDTKFVDLDGFNSAVSWKGFGNFVRCTFANNTLHPTEYGAGLIESDVEDEVGGEGGMRLEQCTIRNNTPTVATIPTFLTDNRAVSENQAAIYSDDTANQVCNIVGDDPLSEIPPCDNSSPLPLSQAGDAFITISYRWLKKVQSDLELTPSDDEADTEAGTADDGDKDDVSVPFVAVASVAGTLLLLACAVFASFLIFARRQKSDESASPTVEQQHVSLHKERSLQSTLSSHSKGNTSMHSSLSIKGNKLPSLRANEISRTTFSMSSSSHNPNSITGTFGATNTMTKMQKPGPGADNREKKAFLEYQLDSLRGQLVLNRLTVLDSVTNRRRGGQAVIQVVEDSRTRMEYAMKFYLSRQAFLDERALYEDPDQPLGQFLPEVHSIVNSGEAGFVDGDGNDLPPCIIMEKGESLDLWAASTGDGLDMVTGLQVMTHLAERLRDLHESGYVHRDIKPGNVLWLPRKKRWTLIDFGCVARIGEQARTGFTLTYAAPEVITSHRVGERAVEANEALDSWSVGILAVEIFTGQPVFDVFESKENVEAMILGEKTAPWEDETKALGLAKRFGHLKGPILALLNREPAERPSMIELQYACKRVLSHTTTIPNTVPSVASPSTAPDSTVKPDNAAVAIPKPAVATAAPIETAETEVTETVVRPQGLGTALPVMSGRTQDGADLTTVEADTNMDESPVAYPVAAGVGPQLASDSDFLPFSSPPMEMAKEEKQF